MAKAGKILILELYDKLLSMLIQDNNILSIHAQRKTAYAVGDIYIGKVQNVSKNIDAAFVDIGNHELTFLSMDEAKDAVVTNRRPDGTLKTGDEVLVQIVKEPIKTKLAGVTARIALSGNYAVVGVGENGESRICVSSKLSRKQQNRFRAIDALQQTAKQYQVIVRTNAGELQDDIPLSEEVRVLSDTLGRILKAADNRVCYSCLYRSEPGYINFVKNAYRAEFDEVITDIPDIYEVLRESFYNSGIEIRFYEDKMLPLYKLYAVETRVKEVLDKKVWLKSGGYLVIEPTEALISIDVNTGKCESGRNQEETFLKINLEAAEMIARQLRARNLSGMILVDFINLKKREDETHLMEYMRNLLKKDSVTASVVDMTGLGLMEITRKKVNPSFAQQMIDAKIFAVRDSETESDMDLLGLEKVKDGKYLKNYELTYLNKAGKEKKYEIVSRSEIAGPEALGKRVSGVSIVAYYENKMLLLREFRMGVNRYIYNLCAGMIEEGESMEECIQRELYEETGLSVKKLITILPPSFSAVAFSDVKTQIAFVEAEGGFEDHTSENEQIEARFYTKEEVRELLETEEFSSRAQLAAYFFTVGENFSKSIDK